ncbi:MAG: hypothetical protein U9P72_02745 [Campylobacterota bacterium]|nr:hypothetical protein [Campylobacterota bacterium]
MKKLLPIIILTPILSIVNAIEINKIAPKINTLKNNKKISDIIDYEVYDPFATAKPLLIEKKIVEKKVIKRVIKQNPIIIQTILNHKVLINNRWYSAGDIVQGRKIKSIRKDAIIVIENNKWVKIALKKNRNIINIKEVIQ